MARYTLIKGEYHIFYPDLPRGGPEPDGDTVTFRPDNPELIRSLPTQGRPPKFNGRKMTSIRLEGIDTLETHFQEMHQELDFANAARDFMLGQLGFTGIQFWPDQPNRVRAVDNNPQRGFVIANEVESNGRTVAFVFSGDSAKADGSDIFLDVTTMEQSVNVALVNASLTYGAFYTTLPIERPTTVSSWACSIRCEIVSRVGAARDGPAHPRAGRRDHGVWGAQPPISTVKIPRKSPKSPKSGTARTLLVSGVVRKNHNFLRFEA